MDALDDRTYELLFGIRRSVRYHDRRRRFHEIWNTFTVAIAAIGGSGATILFFALDKPIIPAAISATVALTGAMDLAVGTVRKADRHGDLARQFITLEQEFSSGLNLEDGAYETLTRRRLQIEASEPVALRLLDAMCHFEVLRSLGDREHHPRVPLYRRILANWISQVDFALRLQERTDGEVIHGAQ